MIFKKAKVIKTETTSSSAIAERPHWRVGKFWPEVEDSILRALFCSSVFNHFDADLPMLPILA